MKKLIVAAAILLYSSVGYSGVPIDVSEKVLESFNQTFKNPVKPTWFENETGYVVYFMNDGIDSRVWYDRKGNILKSFRYYEEEKLPPFLLSNIKKKYTDKTVFIVTEVSDDSGIFYFIKLQDEKNWLTIKATGSGSMEVVEKFKKA